MTGERLYDKSPYSEAIRSEFLPVKEKPYPPEVRERILCQLCRYLSVVLTDLSSLIPYASGEVEYPSWFCRRAIFVLFKIEGLEREIQDLKRVIPALETTVTKKTG